MLPCIACPVLSRPPSYARMVALAVARSFAPLGYSSRGPCSMCIALSAPCLPAHRRLLLVHPLLQLSVLRFPYQKVDAGPLPIAHLAPVGSPCECLPAALLTPFSCPPSPFRPNLMSALAPPAAPQPDQDEGGPQAKRLRAGGVRLHDARASIPNLR